MKRRRNPKGKLNRIILMFFVVGLSITNAPTASGQTLEQRVQDLERQVTEMNGLITDLRAELARHRDENRRPSDQSQPVGEGASTAAIPPPAGGTTADPAGSVASPTSPEARIGLLEEMQRITSDRLAEQYQTKVESTSRYRTKLSGLVLLNTFGNRGKTENPEVPGLALQPDSTDTKKSFGLSALQSQIGLETFGPRLGRAKTSAGLQFDFFGIPSSSVNATAWGAVRLRTAAIRFDWSRTSVVVGQDTPFISPLSPSSVTSLGYPEFYYSGNLWTWIPQARIEHRLDLSEQGSLTLQGGILDPSPRGSGQPSYASRIAWAHGDPERPLGFGIGGFYSRQNRGAGRTGDAWAGTTDWLVPLGPRLGLSGEFFRGRAVGSLGGAQGRSVVSDGPGDDPNTHSVGLNSMGGWAQLSFKASRTVELQIAHGEEHPDLRDLTRFLSAGSSSGAIARNQNEMFNITYRPRTDLLFSLEYRHLKTTRVSPGSETADHINLGIGVLF